jgi:GntR family transcriptional repressor for pyruvate dehydrogenase complex
MSSAGGSTGRKSLPDVVFDRMHRAIKSGAYRPDERLPTEHELSAEFEVSRPIVREALRRLREQGLIYSRQGAGSFVRSIGLKQPLGFGQLENVSDLLNCYAFRLTLEPEAAALAAERYRPTTLASIEAALELLRDATNRQSHREDADFEFHLAIAVAAENSYFSTALEALKDHIAVGMRFHGISIKRDSTGLARVFGEHAAIFEAIRARDVVRARDLMRIHLNGSRERLFERRRPAEEELAAE